MRVEVTVPRINPNSDRVELSLWHVRDLEAVTQGQLLADISTSKATVAIEAETKGYIRLLFDAGQGVDVGVPIALLFADRKEAEAYVVPARKPDTIQPAPGDGTTRLSKAAAQRHAASEGSSELAPGLGLVSSRILSRAGAGQSPRSQPVGAAKLLEIRSLASAGNAFRSSVTVALSAARIQQVVDAAGTYGGSLVPVVLREFCSVVKSFPLSMAYFEKDRIHFFDRVNLGVVLDLGYGIRVPVLRDADRLSAGELHAGIMDFCLRYQNRSLTDADMSGATITATDLSRQNVLSSEPLLPFRQSTILGIGGDRNLEGGPLTLTLAFDHRVLNGREAATFLNQVKERLAGWSG